MVINHLTGTATGKTLWSWECLTHDEADRSLDSEAETLAGAATHIEQCAD